MSFFCLNAPSSVRVLDKKWMKCIIIHVKCIIIDYMHNRKGMTSMKKVFIDGAAGTTGLKIHERLAGREELQLIKLSEEKRKDPDAIREALNASDIAFLCLPDSAAMEAADMVENPDTVVLDTSTAHRTAKGWVYGMPELCTGQREAIRTGKRIAVPGCHASGFIALVRPLMEGGFLSENAALTCFSLTGYTGGGKRMIAQYEAEDRDPLLKAPRQYGLSQAHKHLPEMTAMTGLAVTPIFCPIVADFDQGMEVTVPLFAHDLKKDADPETLKEMYRAYYTTGVIRCLDEDEDGFCSASAFRGLDSMSITVRGNKDRILLIARYDNLGKGASGAAIQCMNLVLGAEETTGLVTRND